MRISLIFLSGPDHEDIANRLVVGGGALGRIAGYGRRQHAVELRRVEVGVADHRIVGRLKRTTAPRTRLRALIRLRPVPVNT
jgi:hypothetical protein